MTTVAILVNDGFEDVEAIMCHDVFKRFNIESYFVSCTNNKTLKTYWGLELNAHKGLNEVINETFDAIILVGGPKNTLSLMENHDLLSFIKRHDAANKWIFAQCSAPARILGMNNLLDNRHYTCSSDLQHGVKDGIYEDVDIVKDGNLVTSKGLGVSLDYALYISDLLLKNTETVKKQAEHIYFPYWKQCTVKEIK